MKRLLVVSKNAFLTEFISNQNYQINWFNGRLIDWTDNKSIDVVLYDGSTYGPLPHAIFRTYPTVILDTYLQHVLIKQHIGTKPFAYLMVHDFIDELQTAIQSVCNGKNYYTNKLATI